jgi:hypothetical protein
MRDVVAATLQTYREMLEGTGDLYTKRDAFQAFWSLVSEAHPVEGCRLGAKVRWPECLVM